MMKELLIRVRLDGDSVETAIKHRGFDASAETSLTVIGILQNIIDLEQEKLRTIRKVKLEKPKQDRDPEYGL